MKKNKGFAMIAYIIALSLLLLVLSLIMLNYASYNVSACDKFEKQAKTKAVAEAGIHYALRRLRQSDTYKGNDNVKLGNCTFTVVVEEVEANKAQRKITSTGYYPDKKTAKAKITVQAIVELANPPSFKWAGFGIDEVVLSGNVLIDSYNSEKGSYNPFLRENNGNVSSNGNISINGNCKIFGNVNAGLTGTLTTIGSVFISGKTSPNTSKIELPVIDCSYRTLNSNSTGISFKDAKSGSYDPKTMVLKTTGKTQVYLQEGTYYFSQMDTANSELVCLGKVVIYCKDSLSLGDGNYNQKPSNLIIYSECTEISFSGGKGFYGVIYAPQAKMTVGGNGDLFGAFVGRTLSNKGTTNIHYDEALNSQLPSVSGDVKIKAWLVR